MASIIVRTGLAWFAAIAVALTGGCAAGHLLMLGGHDGGMGLPEARIVASVTRGAAPLGVDFDFSQSRCSADMHDGHHRFDPGMGGAYDVGDTMHFDYLEPGIYRARLVIEEGQGGASAAEVLITVE